eukprot:10204171-Alexandrium_andersonii.AAC.1
MARTTCCWNPLPAKRWQSSGVMLLSILLKGHGYVADVASGYLRAAGTQRGQRGNIGPHIYKGCYSRPPGPGPSEIRNVGISKAQAQAAGRQRPPVV